jgi:tetratricopeptide (TPR) repeat protein
MCRQTQVKQKLHNMKNSKNWFLAAGLVLTAGAAFGQKAVETSAAVEYKNKFLPAFHNQDMEGAKTSLLKAKEYIDAAAVHPDTKESPKTQMLKGDIYFMLVAFKEMGDAAFASVPADAMDQSIAAYNKAYTISNKFDADIEESIDQKAGLLDIAAVASFNEKKYSDAMEAYDMRAKLYTAVNKTDSVAIFYAGVAAENNNDFGKAADYYKKAADIGYKVPEIYKMVANALIQDKKTEEATAYLEKAIEKSPNDKELHYAVGTFYMEAGQNDKATESLRKAIAIDPKYWDAHYQLGAHLQSQGAAIRNKANALPLNDPNFNKMIAESDEYFKQAVVPLEVYINANPNDKAVLQILSQVHRSLKNAEKAAEYKRRMDEIK